MWLINNVWYKACTYVRTYIYTIKHTFDYNGTAQSVLENIVVNYAFKNSFFFSLRRILAYGTEL